MPDILNPYDGSVVGSVPEHDEQTVRAIIGKAVTGFQRLKALPAVRRAQILSRAADLIDAQTDQLSRLIAMESGKPLKYSRGEVSRAAETFQFAADAARSIHGETIPLDAAKGGIGKIGYFVREPVGVIGAITPFNFPLNLVGHKVAPAIAAGCAIVLKPAPTTPLTALRLQEILQEAGLPEGAYGVVLGDREVGEWLTTDPRIAMLSFTGSPGVAQSISKVVGLRRTTYELGGNGATIIDASGDMEKAIGRTIMGGFSFSGQICISVQRVYVHESRYQAFRDAFVEQAKALKIGDPLQDSTDFGPMITENAAQRVEAWVSEAAQQGATILCGNERSGQLLTPTVLEDVSSEMKVMKEEVFGPVVCLIPFSDFDTALDEVNNSQFGLQAGVYTADLRNTMKAIEKLNVGGVIINDVPTFRVDNMPYGGNRNSGVGREGPRFAIEEMTTLKMVVINA
jgi:acyl-CoA reductase-like NAD-dependent aldehyde dehydrogenase